MKAVILAGGEGTRLRPLTLSIPKPVVPVVDRPFLRHQLDLLARVGISDIVFSVAYQPERIQAVFGDGASLGRRIHYAVEETPLGTGGAGTNAQSHLDDTTAVSSAAAAPCAPGPTAGIGSTSARRRNTCRSIGTSWARASPSSSRARRAPADGSIPRPASTSAPSWKARSTWGPGAASRRGR